MHKNLMTLKIFLLDFSQCIINYNHCDYGLGNIFLIKITSDDSKVMR